MTSIGRHLRIAALGVSLTVLVGCTTLYRNHGYAPDDTQLAEVLVGVDSRATVAEVVGAPTAGGIAGDYYYVQSRFRHYGFTEPREIDREVVAIRFDDEGVVTNVERFGLEQGQIVALSRRVTDDNIKDVTFLKQLFGSLGNFDAGQILNSP